MYLARKSGSTCSKLVFWCIVVPSLSRSSIQFSNYFPIATAKHSRRPETAATLEWEIKDVRLLYPPTRLHGVKTQKNAKWTLKQGNNAKRPGCCHRILKQYFIITSGKTISWRIMTEWTSISLRGIMYVAVGCQVCLCLPATQRHISTLTDQYFKLKAQHRTASEAHCHFCPVCKQKRHVKNVKTRLDLQFLLI